MTSCTLTPSSSQSLTALDFVRFVVPKHGMVTHWISFRLRPAQIERAHAHQQRQRAVQSAGNTEHNRFRVRVLHPLFQTLRLDAQNRLRAGAQLLVIRRDERLGASSRVRNRVAARLKENDRLKAGNGIVACRAEPSC